MTEYVAGCKHIAESIKRDKLFSSVYDQLLGGEHDGSAEVGIKPNMPHLGASPVDVVCNDDNVANGIEGLPLTWLRVERLDKYGVYHNVIALYGDRHWVTRDRAGTIFLRVFAKPF